MLPCHAESGDVGRMRSGDRKLKLFIGRLLMRLRPRMSCRIAGVE